MIAQSGSDSELTRACTIIALACQGKKLRNDTYLKRAKDLYSLSLQSFRLSISNEAIFTSGESLITATLLGLYEVCLAARYGACNLQLQMISVSDAYQGAHVAHARGISAILLSRFSPFNLMCDGKLFQVAYPLSLDDLQGESDESPSPSYSTSAFDKGPQTFSVMCTPVLNRSKSTIDMVYIQTEPLIRRAAVLLNSAPDLDQVRQLLSDAERMKEAYYAWPETTPVEWKPRTVGFIAPREEKLE